MVKETRPPAIQFYPGDWKKDPAIQSLSLLARGAWMEMLFMMFNAPRRGYLEVVEGVPANEKQICRMLGCSIDEFREFQPELEQSGVYSVDSNGVIYSRRMAQDEEKRQNISTTNKENGAKGGRPKSEPKPKANPTQTETKPTKNRAANKPVNKTETESKPKAKRNEGSSIASSDAIAPSASAAKNKTSPPPSTSPKRTKAGPAEGEPTWRKVEEELIDFGITAVKPLIQQAQELYTVPQALLAIAYARKKLIAPNHLYGRLVNIPGSRPVEEGWVGMTKSKPPGDNLYAKKERAQEASRRQTEREAVERNQKYKERRERQEEEFGPLLDSMTTEECLELLKPVSPKLLVNMPNEVKRGKMLDKLEALQKEKQAQQAMLK